MNERDKEFAKQAGFYLYDLMETHEIKTIETDSRDEWVTLQKLIDLIRSDEREACAKIDFYELLRDSCNKEQSEELSEVISYAIRARGNNVSSN